MEDLERKAKKRSKSGLTITGLPSEAASGDDLRVRQLLKNGADINTKDDGGMCVCFNTSMAYPVSEFWDKLSTQIRCSKGGYLS
jgi:hypothetical protein